MLLEFAFVFGIVLVVVAFDILPNIIQRVRNGGPYFLASDFAEAGKLKVLVPLVVIIIFQQQIFEWLGFSTRGDVPYFLGFLATLTVIALALVWWTDRKS